MKLPVRMRSRVAIIASSASLRVRCPPTHFCFRLPCSSRPNEITYVQVLPRFITEPRICDLLALMSAKRATTV